MKTKITILMALLFLMASSINTIAWARGGFEAPVDETGGSFEAPAEPAARDTFTLQNPLKVNSIGALVQNFVEIFSYIAILFAVLAFIWIGFQFVLARGNPTETAKLKGWLGWTVVGVAVILGARLMIDVIINTLSATGTVSPNVIQSARKANSGN